MTVTKNGHRVLTRGNMSDSSDVYADMPELVDIDTEPSYQWTDDFAVGDSEDFAIRMFFLLRQLGREDELASLN
jgi:hypothetical protein